MTKIDCLICHDRTGTYLKAPTEAGMPDPKVDLVQVAKSVGRTSRKTCGDCHFNGGGGDAVKHADMSRQLLDPERSCDIHMGGYDFQCAECHRTRNHKIAGRSTSVPVSEGGFSCENCHGDQPHSCDSLLDPPPEQAQRNHRLQHLPLAGVRQMQADDRLLGLVQGRRQEPQAPEGQIRHG